MKSTRILALGLFVTVLSLTAGAQTAPTTTAAAPTTASAEAQLRIYRALAAAADDVARQVEAQQGPRQEAISFILYDPRILNDLLVLKGFGAQLEAYQHRLLWLNKKIDEINPDAVKPGPATNPTGYDYLQATLDKFHQIARPQTMREATKELKGSSKPAFAGALSILFSAVASIFSPTPATASTGGTSSSGTPFLPNTLSGALGLLTTNPASLYTATSSANGVAGPATAESFVMGRIAKRLPGIYYYPSFVPIDVNDPSNPLQELFKLQLDVHDAESKVQGKLTDILTAYQPAIQAQIKAEGYWQAPTAVHKYFDDGYAYLKTGPGARTPVEWAQLFRGEASDAEGQMQMDVLLDAKSRANAVKVLKTLQAELDVDLASGSFNNLRELIWQRSIDLLQYLVVATKQYSFAPPTAVTTLYTDIGNIISPLAGPPSSAQVLTVQNDILSSKTALTQLSGSTFALTIALLDKFSGALNLPLKAVDPMVSLMQVVDGTVVALNSAAGPSSSASAAPAASAASTTPSATASTTTNNPALPSAGSATDTLATVLVRSFAYRHMLDTGSRILRVSVEMSAATDRVDSFGPNVPSRKSSAAAQLSFSIYDASGKMQSTGTSLAYLPTALAGDPLTSDHALIMRDEPEGEVVAAGLSLAITATDHIANQHRIEAKITAKKPVSKNENGHTRDMLKDAVLTWQILDSNGEAVTEPRVFDLHSYGTTTVRLELTDAQVAKLVGGGKAQTFRILIDAVCAKDESTHFANASTTLTTGKS